MPPATSFITEISRSVSGERVGRGEITAIRRGRGRALIRAKIVSRQEYIIFNRLVYISAFFRRDVTVVIRISVEEFISTLTRDFSIDVI
jgi:hypothetical protein